MTTGWRSGSLRRIVEQFPRVPHPLQNELGIRIVAREHHGFQVFELGVGLPSECWDLLWWQRFQERSDDRDEPCNVPFGNGSAFVQKSVVC